MDLTAESDETDLFDMSRKMTGKLKQLAEENGGKFTRTSSFPNARLCGSGTARLLTILRGRFSAIRIPGTTAEREIMLVQAKDPADEIDFITNRIEELVKKDGTATGISPWSAGIFRDMAGRSREALKRIGSRCS